MFLSEILEKAGVSPEDQGLLECENIHYKDIGFFSWRTLQGFAYVVHFWIRPDKRTPGNFYKMARFVKQNLRSKGFKLMIVNAPESGYVSKFVRAYAKTEPYSRQHGQHYYLLGVDDYGQKQNTGRSGT